MKFTTMTTTRSRRKDLFCIYQSFLTLVTTRSSRNSSLTWSLRLWQSIQTQLTDIRRTNKWRRCQISSLCASTRRSYLTFAIYSHKQPTTSSERPWKEERGSSNRRISTPKSIGIREAKNCFRLERRDNLMLMATL